MRNGTVHSPVKDPPFNSFGERPPTSCLATSYGNFILASWGTNELFPTEGIPLCMDQWQAAAHLTCCQDLFSPF